MKIICIARNYGDHAAEMGAPQYRRGSTEALAPAFFLKPESALLTDGRPFHYPDFSRQVEHEVEVVVRICKDGKNILQEHVRDYYDAVTVGIDFTARDLQRQAKAKGLPWTLSKGFDESAPVGRFVSLQEMGNDVSNMSFRLLKNGQAVQQGNTGEMLCSVDGMISYVSRYISLSTGDLIFTGTPSGVGPVEVGDRLVAELEGLPLLQCEVVGGCC